MTLCKICGGASALLFKKKILNKYSSGFYCCSHCGFMQTDESVWLDEAYADAISDMDTGLLIRNYKYANIVPYVIKTYFNPKAKFLDYGAGFGIFVRLMRDRKFDFYWLDEHCQNLFAKKFGIDCLPDSEEKFELVTSFEVFEHLKDPVVEVEKMLQYSDSILFSTNIIPKKISNLQDWWYLSVETGQHIAFYSLKSLQILAEKTGSNFYTNGYNFHLFTKKKINPFLFVGLLLFKKLVSLFRNDDTLSGAHADRTIYNKSLRAPEE